MGMLERMAASEGLSMAAWVRQTIYTWWRKHHKGETVPVGEEADVRVNSQSPEQKAESDADELGKDGGW